VAAGESSTTRKHSTSDHAAFTHRSKSPTSSKHPTSDKPTVSDKPATGKFSSKSSKHRTSKHSTTAGTLSTPGEQPTGVFLILLQPPSSYRSSFSYKTSDDAETHDPSTHATKIVTIWKLGRTVCVYSMVQRREKEKDSRYIQEASAPAAVTVYQTCNIMYICNKNHRINGG